jgi:serine/threonine protein kinase
MVTLKTTNSAIQNAAEPWSSPVVSRFLAGLSDRYVVDRQLGRGGMGVVYLARDARLGRPVAIKVLYPEIAERIDPDMFQGEIRITAALQHPHILPVLDSGCLDGVCYCVTPYMAEGSLYELLHREGPLPYDRAVGMALDVLEALECAHSQGVVHCDIKPENILLSHGHAVLADFGIARTMSSFARRGRDEVWGSPAYISPEQASGEAELDGRSDLYSLGCVLYEMLVGAQAFTGVTTLAVVAKKLTAKTPDLGGIAASIPRKAADAIARTLALDPGDRFPSARALARQLAQSLTDAPQSWKPSSGGGRLRPRIARWVTGAVLAATLLGLG